MTPRQLGLGAAIGMLLVVAVAVAVAIADNAANRVALQFMWPVVDALSRLGLLFFPRPLFVLDLVGGGVALVLGLTAAIGLRRDSNAARLLAAAACALVGQLLLLHKLPIWGVSLYGLAVVATLASRDDTLAGPSPRRTISPLEVAQLLAVTALATVFRFFALNRVPSYFEGELSPYMVGATDLQGMFMANAGWHGPWAPLGLLYYIPIYPMTIIAGTTVLAVRLAPAIIGVLTVGAVYLFARELAGRYVALTAAAIVALDPLQIGWSRSDVHPHGVTTWPALLLAWATVRAVETGKTAWFVAVAALMALTWHQYPSGQLVLFVPIITLLFRAVTHGGFVRSAGWRLGLIAVGLVAWLAGHSVTYWLGSGTFQTIRDYIGLLGPRVVNHEAAVTTSPIGHLLGNAGDLITGMFVRVPHLFHQTFIPEVSYELGVRSLPWFVASLVVIGLCLMVIRLPGTHAVVTLSLAACAAAPAVLSDIPFVKRAAVLYPVLEVISAVAIVALVRSVKAIFGTAGIRTAVVLMATGLCAWSSVAAAGWFSSRLYRWGTPPEEIIAQAIGRELAPRTLVLACFWDDYMVGKFSYLLVDDLRREDVQPVAWYVPETWSDTCQRLTTRPDGAVRELAGTPWYILWPGLERGLPAILGQRVWHRVVYLMEEDQHTDARIELIRSVCADTRVTRFDDLGDEDKYRMRLVVCEGHDAFQLR